MSDLIFCKGGKREINWRDCSRRKNAPFCQGCENLKKRFGLGSRKKLAEKKRREKPVKTKEAYRLNWEYLRRSGPFKELCDSIRKDRQKGILFRVKIPDDIEGLGGNEQIPNLTVLDNSWPGRPIGIKIIAGAEGSEKNKKMESLMDGYNFFGDIFSSSFDDWWYCHSLKKEKDSISNITPIMKAILNFEKMPMNLGISLKKKWAPDGFLGDFLRVDFVPGQTKESIIKRFRKFISGKKLNWGHVTGAVYPAVEKYLTTYDQFKKLKEEGKDRNQIFHHFFPTIRQKVTSKSLPKKVNNEWCVLQRDYRYAKKIIANVEGGDFPGKYRQVIFHH